MPAAGLLSPGDTGSNAWAVGADRVTGGEGGLLVGNPHFPWEGELRFWEAHLTVPGEIDIYGGNLIGLPGIGIGFTAAAAVDYLITRANIYDVQRAAVWLTGSLNGRSWDDVRTIGFALIVLAPAILLAQRRLDSLDLGDDTAAALGVSVGRSM